MYSISVPSMILISFPEAVVLCLLGLLSIGRFHSLEKKSGLLKIVLFSAIITVLIYFIRPNLNNEIENMLVYILMIFMLFIIIMGLKFYESFFATIFATLIFIVTEGICLITISAITGIKMNHELTDITRFFMTLPERIIQLLLIYILYKYSIKIIDFEYKTSKKRSYYIQLSVYLVSLGIFTFLSVLMARLLLVDNSQLSETSAVMLRINIYLTFFVTIVLTLSIRSINEFYKNKNILSNNEIKQSLEYISNLAENGDTEKVREALKSLKMHVEKQNFLV